MLTFKGSTASNPNDISLTSKAPSSDSIHLISRLLLANRKKDEKDYQEAFDELAHKPKSASDLQQAREFITKSPHHGSLSDVENQCNSAIEAMPDSSHAWCALAEVSAMQARKRLYDGGLGQKMFDSLFVAKRLDESELANYKFEMADQDSLAKLEKARSQILTSQQ